MITRVHEKAHKRRRKILGSRKIKSAASAEGESKMREEAKKM